MKPITSQESYSDTLRYINFGLLKGLEYKNLYGNSLNIIEYQDSIIVRWSERFNELLTDNMDKEIRLMKLEKKIDTFWDDIKEYGMGFAIGGVLTALLIIIF